MPAVFIADLNILQLVGHIHLLAVPAWPPKNINQNIGCYAQNMAMLFIYLVVMHWPSNN